MLLAANSCQTVIELVWSVRRGLGDNMAGLVISRHNAARLPTHTPS